MRHLNKKYWPCKVKVSNGDLQDHEDVKKVNSAVVWCVENQVRYCIVGANHFYFRTEEDAAFFALKFA